MGKGLSDEEMRNPICLRNSAKKYKHLNFNSQKFYPNLSLI